MKVTQVQLKNFRNYQAVTVDFSSGVQVFFGRNAQGKTNLLEAIFFAVLSKSFRTATDEEMIHWTAAESCLDISFQNKVADHRLQFKIQRGEKRENLLNGQAVKKKDVIGYLNAVLFSPEDLLLIKGNPAGRRRFIDLEISQTQPVYYRTLLAYQRALYQRNYLLKQIQDGQAKRNILDLWDDQLIPLAEKLTLSRRENIQRLSERACKIHDQITTGAESFSAHYLVFGASDTEMGEYRTWYKEMLAGSRERDIRRGTTEFGPHKDDLLFTINAYDGKVFASQGQQRTAVLALKLAEIELMHELIGEYPILLLDDVMSELDEKRRVNLIEEINGKVQTFITGTEKIQGLSELKPTYYRIDSGSVSLNNGSFAL